jgi:hypothetical protein
MGAAMIYLTYDQWRAHVEGSRASDDEYAAFLEDLRRNPLKPTAIVIESRRREQTNKLRGGRSGHDW